MKIPYLSSIPREWRTPRALIILFVSELPFTIAALALFGIASPNLYRTLLWQEGSNHGWNSNPNEILYAYANYKPINVPLPWSQFVTSFNVVISVLSMFILLAKSVLYIMHLFPPILSALVHAVLIALYALSLRNQAASDMTDPLHPAKVPWYLTKSCGPPVTPSLHGYCQQAKGAFAVTICLFTLFFTYLCFSLFSLLRTALLSPNSPSVKSVFTDIESPVSPSAAEQKWEMDHLPRTHRTAAGVLAPMTPRTLAFNTLDGSVRQGNGAVRSTNRDGGLDSARRKSNKELPLRHHISMGEETYSGPRK